jgi:hypothetical protein
MFIQTQDTPNPATLKFIPGVPVMQAGTADYPAADSASNSPLARRLFQVDGVAGVFLGGEFVFTKAVNTGGYHGTFCLGYACC